MKRPKRDLTGKHIADWYILEFVGRRRGLAEYKAKCKCGEEKIIIGVDVERGKSKSCKACSVKTRYSNRNNKRIGKQSPSWKGYKDIPRAIFTKCKYGAQKRGLQFDLKIEDLQELWEKQNKKCAYSNRTLFFNNKSFSTSDKTKMFDFASLDRIDSTRGYVKGNIQWVTQAVNIAKNAYNDDVFLKLIQDIYKTRIKD